MLVLKHAQQRSEAWLGTYVCCPLFLNAGSQLLPLQLFQRLRLTIEQALQLVRAISRASYASEEVFLLRLALPEPKLQQWRCPIDRCSLLVWRGATQLGPMHVVLLATGCRRRSAPLLLCLHELSPQSRLHQPGQKVRRGCMCCKMSAAASTCHKQGNQPAASGQCGTAARAELMQQAAYIMMRRLQVVFRRHVCAAPHLNPADTLLAPSPCCLPELQACPSFGLPALHHHNLRYQHQASMRILSSCQPHWHVAHETGVSVPVHMYRHTSLVCPIPPGLLPLLWLN